MSARPRPPVLVLAAALAAWPFLFPSVYDLRLLTLVGIYALMVIGFQFIFGHAGALSLTQGTFFGIGAYVTALLSTRFGLGFEITLPAAIAAPMALAVVVALPVLRLQSHYFALATLGIAQVVFLIGNGWEGLTGGANGIGGVPGIVLFGTAVPRGWPHLLLVWGVVALGATLAWRITRGLSGRTYQVMREDGMTAQCLGLDTGRMRFSAFLLSAAFAGAAGAFYATTMRVVSPDVLQFPIMVTCLGMTLIGGSTSIAGAILGAFLLVHLPEWFRFLEQYYLIAFGAAVMAMVIVAPEGAMGALDRWHARRRPAPLPPRPLPLPPRAVPAEAAPLLIVESLSKRFGGVTALDQVSLTVRTGQILGLIGPNGSGKTTLLNIISGLYPADCGSIRLDGAELRGQIPFNIARRGVARTFQAFSLIETMTALDNVAVGHAAVNQAKPSDGRGHAMALLDQMGVADDACRPVAALAYGTKKRVEIARALRLSPRLLLLDEPAAGLSEEERADLAQRLRQLAADGLAIVLIEHDMSFLMPLAETMVCLALGRVIATGTPGEIRANARVIESYLGLGDRALVS